MLVLCATEIGAPQQSYAMRHRIIYINFHFISARCTNTGILTKIHVYITGFKHTEQKHDIFDTSHYLDTSHIVTNAESYTSHDTNGARNTKVHHFIISYI